MHLFHSVQQIGTKGEKYFLTFS